MNYPDDTIAAVSTSLGEGGIGIVRLSGKDAVKIAGKLFHPKKDKNISETPSHRILYGFIKDPSTNETVDEALVSVMLAPNTYTREDVIEINCHGGISPLRKILGLVITEGARLAEPGEFTKRAFLNGRLDLSEAEAVIDLIRSKTDESRRIALGQLKGRLSEKITSLRNRLTDICVNIEASIDFPEEDIELSSKKAILESTRSIREELGSLIKSYDEGRFFREGLAAAIVGRPNVGKSSLLNALLQKDRAIVTDIPGTTRDTIEEFLDIKGLPLRVIDTAGIRAAHDMAEAEGVKRSLMAIEGADLIITVIDGTQPLHREDIEVLEKVRGKKTIVVVNKSDIISSEARKQASPEVTTLLLSYSSRLINISATRGDGLEELKDEIFNSSLGNWKESKEGVIVTNMRHKILIQAAYDSMRNALSAMENSQPVEILAFELRDALDKLGEIVGAVTTDDILNRIFSDFCIGK